MKFKYLPSVIMQERFICDDSRAILEVIKYISLQLKDMSSIAKASDEATLMEHDISCATLLTTLESHTVPTLKWWLLWHWIHTWETWIHHPVYMYEMLVLSIDFNPDCSKNDTRKLNCPLLAYCHAHVQHSNRQAFRHATHQSPDFWHFHNLLLESCRNSIVTL